MIELKPIRVSKDLIQEPLKFEKELGLRFFKECILKFNQIENLDKEIIFSFDELRKNFQLKNTEDFKEFMKFFHTEIDGRKNVFTTDKGDLIGGGVFSTRIYQNENKIGAMLNPYHKQFIYSKFDIDNWHSVKGNPKEIHKLEIQKEEKEYIVQAESYENFKELEKISETLEKEGVNNSIFVENNLIKIQIKESFNTREEAEEFAYVLNEKGLIKDFIVRVK